MKVHLIKRQTINNFVTQNAGSKSAFADWITKIKHANWNTPIDVKKTFNSADMLGKSSHRIVFDIGGNNYRMICKYGFGENQIHLFICWVGTHAEYDELCNQGKQYSINIY